MYDLGAQHCGGQGGKEEGGTRVNEMTPHAQGSSLVQKKLVLVRHVLTVSGSSKQSDGRQDAIPVVTMKISLVVKNA